MSYRFAIIGCGNIAGRHAVEMSRTGKLVAVCDTIVSRAEKIGNQYDAAVFDSAEDLLVRARPDLVAVCTPNGLHPVHSIRALKAGCHVLCEKPMSIRFQDAREMIHTARENQRKLWVVKQNRYNPPVTTVKKLLNEGKLGRIHQFQMNCFWNRPAAYYKSDWKGTLALDGGTLYTQFSHFIDLLYWFLGDIESATGYRRNSQHQGLIEFEDEGAALISLKNGTKGTLQYSINSFAQNMEGSITLFGEKGTVKIGGQYLNTLEYFKVENEEKKADLPVNGPNQYGLYQGSMSNHHLVYDELISALEKNPNGLVEAEEASHSIKMIETIYSGSPLA